MICHHNGRVLRSKALAAYFLAFASASTIFIGSITPLSADASTSSAQPKRNARSLDTDPGPDGESSYAENGSVNSKTIAVESPTNNHGYQHTSTSTPGGATSIQNALCRRTPVCNITQNVFVVSPEKAREAVEATADTITPQEADAAVPEDVETLTPGNATYPGFNRSRGFLGSRRGKAPGQRADLLLGSWNRLGTRFG
jgi:hypothetical protein